MPLSEHFGDRLLKTFKERGQLCVGIDPHSEILSKWKLKDTPEGLETFSNIVLGALISQKVGIVKPQVAFFEKFGAEGFRILANLTQNAREAGLLVIADAKRGDIGTTMDAYLEAWFGSRSGLFADALTVSPYLGIGAVQLGFEKFQEHGKGIFSLVATSNPEGASVQLAQVRGSTLAADQYSKLREANGSAKLGSFGAVLGATLDFAEFGIGLETSNVPVLAPGFGAQGAKLSQAKDLFGQVSKQTCFSVSRSILSGGPEALTENIRTCQRELESALAG